MPPVIHKGFKTSNVLVDENFVAKVADTGMVKLLQKIEDGDPSQTSESNVFSDPEYVIVLDFRYLEYVYCAKCIIALSPLLLVFMFSNSFCLHSELYKKCLLTRIPNLEELREASDVYSFGVFLLELVTGREVAQLISHESAGSLAQWVMLQDDAYYGLFPSFNFALLAS